MTVTTTYEPATYTGDGSTTEFALSHQVKQSSHLSITIDGVSTSAWSATGYGDNAGVTVTFDGAPSNGSSIVIKRIVPYTQDTDLENFDGNPADVTESQFDLLAMADQQIVELSNRAVVFPLGASVSSKEISGTITSSSKILTVNSDGPTLSELSGISTSLDAIFTGLASDDLIQYNGTNWVNITVADLGLVDSSENNTFTGDNIFQGVVDVTNVNAEGSGGGHLRTSGGTNCLSWGGGGSANLTAGGNLSMDTTHKIVNCADPTSAQDVATKAYVDSAGRPILHIQDQKSAGTDGGSFSSGAWRTRDLNTEMTDDIGSTLSSNQFTLPVGTYFIRARAPAHGVGYHKAKLYNVTDTADVLIGSTVRSRLASESGSTVTNDSWVIGEFTIADTKTFEIQHICSDTYSEGFGRGNSFSVIEVYTDVYIEKVG